MKAFSLCIFFYLLALSSAFSQNYLFPKDKSGFSGFFGVLTKVDKDRTGLSLGADYTFSGDFSVGVTRTFLRSNEIYIKENKGYFTFNFSFNPLKLETGKSTFSFPLFAGLSPIGDEHFFTYGARIAMRNQMSTNSSFIPVFSIFSQPNFGDIDDPSSMVYSVELNIILEFFRIAPQFAILDGDVRFGINVGLVL